MLERKTDSEPARPWGAMGLTVGGVAAAFSVAACCALPILLGSIGVGTAWLFAARGSMREVNLSFIRRFRPRSTLVTF